MADRKNRSGGVLGSLLPVNEGTDIIKRAMIRQGEHHSTKHLTYLSHLDVNYVAPVSAGIVYCTGSVLGRSNSENIRQSYPTVGAALSGVKRS